MEFEIGVFVLSLKLQKLFLLILASQRKNNHRQVGVPSECFSVFDIFICTKYIQKWEAATDIYRWKMKPTVKRA